MIQYRVCWAASSSIAFEGETDWFDNDGHGDTEDEVRAAVEKPGAGPMRAASEGEDLFWESAGPEWWVETRTVEGAS